MTTVVTAKAEDENRVLQDTASAIDMPANACENSKEIPEVCSFNVEHKPVIDKATTEDVNKSIQHICENSEQTSVKADEQEPNITSPAEPSGNAADVKPSTRQRQAIVAGIVGAVLLVGSVAFYALKIHVTVVVAAGVVGLVCMGFALYNAIKPNTKIEKIEGAEQPVSLNPA